MKNTKFKKIISVLMLTSLLNPATVMAAGKLPKEAAEKEINIRINGVMQNIPSDYGRAYLNKNTNRVMVPARFVTERLGSTIEYAKKYEDYPDGALLVGTEDGPIIMPINSNKYILIREEKTGFLDSKVTLYDGRTYVPIRFLSETMGHEVDWKDGEVLIKKSSQNKSAKNNIDKNLNNKTKEDEISNKAHEEDKVSLSQVDRALNKKDYKNIYKTNLNNYRAQNGLDVLRESEELNKIAQIRVAEEMETFVKNGEADHNSPSGSNVNLGENLYCWRTPLQEDAIEAKVERSLEAWKNSEGHNKNLLYKKAREYGYAYGVVENNGKAHGISIYVFK